MENASKALLMAGYILIAIFLIGAVILTFSKNTSMQTQERSEKESEQLAEFNKQYESYHKGRMFGVDILSVMNKVVDNNQDNEGFDDYCITAKVTLREPFYGLSASTYTVKKPKDTLYSKIFSLNEKQLKEFKQKVFQCTGITYHEKTGRVATISFKEVEVKRDP